MAVIESEIAGTFRGAEGRSLYRLTNGQIWEQSEYYYEYHYHYRPRVRIVQEGSQLVMRVEGMSNGIKVRQVR